MTKNYICWYVFVLYFALFPIFDLPLLLFILLNFNKTESKLGISK